MAFNIEMNGDIYLKQGDYDVREFSFSDNADNPIDVEFTIKFRRVLS